MTGSDGLCVTPRATLYDSVRHRTTLCAARFVFVSALAGGEFASHHFDPLLPHRIASQ